MPCTDNGYTQDQQREVDRLARLPEAMLCALINAIDSEHELTAMLDFRVNWKEAGITRQEFNAWRAEHRRRDEQRRKKEQERQQKARDSLRVIQVGDALTEDQRDAILRLLGQPSAQVPAPTPEQPKLEIDWSKAPRWADWLARDADGDWYWYVNRPVMGEKVWTPHRDERYQVAPAFHNPASWENTLECRGSR